MYIIHLRVESIGLASVRDATLALKINKNKALSGRTRFTTTS